MDTKKIITFDLDSTLCDTRHRHHMINPDGHTDWRAYSLACAGDSPIWPVITMLHSLEETHDIWIVSGRDHVAYDLTIEWLHIHGITPAGVVLMTPLDAHRYPDHLDYKVAAVDRVEEVTAREVVLHVDDWPPVVSALLRHGRAAICVSSPQHLAGFEPKGPVTFV